MSEEGKKNGATPPPAEKRDNKPNMPGPGRVVRIPGSLIFWGLLIIFFAVMYFWKGSESTPVKQWTQSEFERRCASSNITSATVVPEEGGMLYIEGEYKLSPAEIEAAKLKNPNPPTTGKFQTRVLESDKIADLLSQTQIKIQPKDNWFTSLLAMVLPVLIIGIIIYILFSRQIKMANRNAVQFGKSRARMIMPDELKIKFSDVAGADEAKEEIQEIVEYLKDPIKFKLLGGKIPRGCLLVGPPGTGKTLLAKAVACEAKVPFFSISGSDFVEMFVGVGASRVRDMFEHARRNTPCLIFIDEIDAVGRSRFSGMGGGHDEREQTLNAMLVEMDGLENRSDVIVLAATNRPDVLDPALLRPGRFDRQVVLDLPDIRGRRQILDVHAKNIRLSSEVNLDTIAQSTPGFSGADLANLCNEAALLAARYNHESVLQCDMEEARDKVCFGRERRSRKISERERKLTAYHESGHALVGLHCEHTDPLHKITIVPRGQAYLGATFSIPKEDVYTKSKLELLDQMAMTLGGRAAEEIIFGDITTGAGQDIEVVSRLARMMVCAYGMNDKIGPIKYGDFRSHVHIRFDAPPVHESSEATAREIDIEVKKLIDDAHARALAILNEHRDELEKLAQTLLEKETISAAEVDVLLGRTAAEPQDVPAENTDSAASNNSEAAESVTAAAEAAETAADNPDSQA
ncbi:MAG: ATP-dependent zinc metalloprotease FtsH [Lentisphaerae bacterium]|nr:ATP-dependent zinc metalloprotease FtsH [Lentisphaerota bacterium]